MAATNKNKTDKEGFIDLGEPISMQGGVIVGLGADEANAEGDKDASEKIEYPSLYIKHSTDEDNELDGLPDGEFEAVIKAKVTKYTVDKENGTCSCEIDVMAIKPLISEEDKEDYGKDDAEEEGKDAGEHLDGALDKIAAAKEEMDNSEEDDEKESDE